MIQIKILVVGRAKEPWLEEGVGEYKRRLGATAKLETIWVSDDAQLLRLVAKEPLAVCLDITGQGYSSDQFSQWLSARVVEGGSRLTFVIGGADGLPKELRQSSLEKISLSPLTFTHQLARLVLAEQLYRAFEILRGSPYAR